MNCHIIPFSFPPNPLYTPFAEYGQSSHEHAAAATNYHHSLYHTRHLWNAVSLTPPQDGGGNPGGALWPQQREARPPPPVPPPPSQPTLGQIPAALATPSPLSSAGSNEENEATLPVVNNAAASDLCEDDEDPGMNTL